MVESPGHGLCAVWLPLASTFNVDLDPVAFKMVFVSENCCVVSALDFCL